MLSIINPSTGAAFPSTSAEAHRQRTAIAASPLSVAVHAAFPEVESHTRTPTWDTPMRDTARMFIGRTHESTSVAAIVTEYFRTTRYAVEAFIPNCPPLTAHDAARGILLRHMMEFAT